MQNTFALEYVEAGLVPVLLTPNGKGAFLPGWTRLRPARLLKQFDRRSGNIGIRLGRQTNGTFLFAIDVDPRHGGSLESLVQNRQFPATAHALTAGGGEH